MIYLNKRKTTNIIILIIVLVSLSLSFYFYYQLHNLKNNTNSGSGNQEVKDLVNKVSKLYLVPSNEDPTIATVSDPEILKTQSFFSLSEKGDKVLIFTKAGKAVLYRPSINKIIETAPIKNNPLNNTNIEPNIDETNVPSVKEKTN